MNFVVYITLFHSHSSGVAIDFVVQKDECNTLFKQSTTGLLNVYNHYYF